MDGLETTPTCSADAVDLSLPADAVVPAKPGCGGARAGGAQAAASPTGTVGDKISTWFKKIVH
jgi:hypothetical protein